MPLADRPRGAMKVKRARVVAEPGPVGEHVVLLRAGERRHVGETRHEALVIRDDGRHLGLLEHDLGDPDAIRVAAALPRQTVAPVHALPRDDVLREILHFTTSRTLPAFTFDDFRTPTVSVPVAGRFAKGSSRLSPGLAGACAAFPRAPGSLATYRSR